jgi:MFS transporter, putative metabolite:H+ symporter
MLQELPAVTEASIVARIERLPLSAWFIRTMAIVGIANFFDGFDSLTIAFVLPVLIGEWHIAPAQIGYLISAGYLGQMVGAIGLSWLAERHGRLRALRWNIAILSVLSIGCAFATSYGALFAFRTLQGLGLGGEVPVAAAYLNELSKSTLRGRIFLFYQSSFAVGIVATSLIAVWVIPSFGWQWMFVLGAIPAILAIGLRRLLPESPRWLANQGRLQEADAIVSDIEAKVAPDGLLPPLPRELPPIERKRTDWRGLFVDGYAARTVSLWIITLFTSIAGYGLLTWMPSIFRTIYHLPLSQALQYGLASSLASLLGAFACALMIDKIGRRWTFMLSFAGCAVPLLVLWQDIAGAPSLEVLALSCLSLFFMTFLIGGIYVYAPEIYPTRMRAFGTGVVSAWLRIGSIVGPTMVGLILSGSGVGGVFLFFAVTALLGAAVVFLCVIETRRRLLEEIAR